MDCRKLQDLCFLLPPPPLPLRWSQNIHPEEPSGTRTFNPAPSRPASCVGCEPHLYALVLAAPTKPKERTLLSSTNVHRKWCRRHGRHLQNLSRNSSFSLLFTKLVRGDRTNARSFFNVRLNSRPCSWLSRPPTCHL